MKRPRVLTTGSKRNTIARKALGVGLAIATRRVRGPLGLLLKLAAGALALAPGRRRP
jgi:hypothetical protein